jgi:hypothetical protein
MYPSKEKRPKLRDCTLRNTETERHSHFSITHSWPYDQVNFHTTNCSDHITFTNCKFDSFSMFLFQVVIYLSGFRIFCFVNQISSCCFNVCLACWVVLENLFGYWEREKLGTWAGIFGVFVFLFCVCLCVVSFWGSVICLCLFKFF